MNPKESEDQNKPLINYSDIVQHNTSNGNKIISISHNLFAILNLSSCSLFKIMLIIALNKTMFGLTLLKLQYSIQ